MTDSLCSFDNLAYGVTFRFTAESAQLLEAMKQCKPWQQDEVHVSAAAEAVTEFFLARSGERFQLMLDDTSCGIVDDLSEALNLLAREVILHVADYTPDRVFIHAGVVAWNGRALVMPGSSFAGKSTLVAELVKAGATYYSDEYAVLDEAGWVHPYARDLSLREAGGITQHAVSVCQLGGRAGIVPVPVSHVIFVEYSDSATWNPKRMTQGAAVLAMMEHAIAVQRAPQRVMSTLALMMNTATALRSQRGDAARTAATLLQMMSEPQAS